MVDYVSDMATKSGDRCVSLTSFFLLSFVTVLLWCRWPGLPEGFFDIFSFNCRKKFLKIDLSVRAKLSSAELKDIF